MGLAQLLMERGEADLEWKVEGKGGELSCEGWLKWRDKRDNVEGCVSNAGSIGVETMFVLCRGCN